MNRQTLHQMREFHVRHIAFVERMESTHLDLAPSRAFVAELDHILEHEWFTPAEVFNALSATVDARKTFEQTQVAA